MKQHKTFYQAIFFSVILTALAMLLLSIFFYWFSGYFNSLVSADDEPAGYAAGYFERAALVLFASSSLILTGAFIRYKKHAWGRWLIIGGSVLLTLACLVPVIQFTQSTSAPSTGFIAVALWLVFATPHALLTAFLRKQGT